MGLSFGVLAPALTSAQVEADRRGGKRRRVCRGRGRRRTCTRRDRRSRNRNTN